MNFFSEHLDDFVSLLYPRLCAACSQALVKGEEVICTSCIYHLPQTHFHLERNNALEKHFWGRVELFRASSQFYFQKGSRVQHLVHQLKYKGKKQIGITLGKMYGYDLRNCNDYDDVQVILPVPLHRSKELKRGYNQADLFCAGLSSAMLVPWKKHLIERVQATETQTHKSRFERWENVGEVFQITEPGWLEGKHVLLTDDVVTTGSTLEACARAICAIRGTKVSVATIACAMH